MEYKKPILELRKEKSKMETRYDTQLRRLWEKAINEKDVNSEEAKKLWDKIKKKDKTKMGDIMIEILKIKDPYEIIILVRIFTLVFGKKNKEKLYDLPKVNKLMRKRVKEIAPYIF